MYSKVILTFISTLKQKNHDKGKEHIIITKELKSASIKRYFFIFQQFVKWTLSKVISKENLAKG